jgi:hypothetical protein
MIIEDARCKDNQVIRDSLSKETITKSRIINNKYIQPQNVCVELFYYFLGIIRVVQAPCLEA